MSTRQPTIGEHKTTMIEVKASAKKHEVACYAQNKDAAKDRMSFRMRPTVALCQVAFLVIGSVLIKCAYYKDGFIAGYTSPNGQIESLREKEHEQERRLQTLEATNTNVPLTHPAYCPQAQCTNTAVCKPCQQRFLVILSEGRAASTTLQYMLGSLPGVRMAGENKNALGQFHEMLHVIMDDASFQKGVTVEGAWHHNPIPHQSQACVAQQFVQMLNPPLLNQQDKNKFLLPQKEVLSEIIAFKTVRFFGPKSALIPHGSQDSFYSVPELVQFLNDNFPCARYVVNINSDIKHLEQDYARLGWKQDTGHGALVNMQRRMQQFVTHMGPDRAILLDKVEWTDKTIHGVDKLNDVVTWLGFPEACHFPDLLQFNTQSNGYGHGKTSFGASNPNCTRI